MKKNTQEKNSNNYIIGGIILVGCLISYYKRNKGIISLTDLDDKTGTFQSEWIENDNIPGSMSLNIRINKSEISGIYTLSGNLQNGSWGRFIINGQIIELEKSDIKAAEIIIGEEGWISLALQFDTIPPFTYVLKYTDNNIFLGTASDFVILSLPNEDGSPKKFKFNGLGKLSLN